MTEEITLATAIEAYRGISFSPERRGEHFLTELPSTSTTSRSGLAAGALMTTLPHWMTR